MPQLVPAAKFDVPSIGSITQVSDDFFINYTCFFIDNIVGGICCLNSFNDIFANGYICICENLITVLRFSVARNITKVRQCNLGSSLSVSPRNSV